MFILFLVFFDLIFRRNYRRYRYYKLAEKCSFDKKKPLLVIGSNSTGGLSSRIISGFDINLYGCGDLCVDSLGCDLCPNSRSEKIENVLLELNNNSYVIFISCVLEYVDDLPNIIKELERVSGGDLFVVYIDNLFNFMTSATYFEWKSKSILSRKWVIQHAPPAYNNWKFYKV